MGDNRRFSRHLRDRSLHPRRHISLVLFLSLILAVVFFRYVISASPSCVLSPQQSVHPDLMFVVLTNASTVSSSIKGFANLDSLGKSCIIRLYTTSEKEYEYCASSFQQSCVSKKSVCMVDVKFLKDARMWGDISLKDVSISTTVIFLHAGIIFTTRALEWVLLAHQGIDSFYDEGGRRDYVGAAIGCEGEKSLTPWWSHTPGPLNFTCAFAPVRKGREDLWEFFVSWFGARRREWVLWPQIWEEESAVPTFWRSNNRNKRDRKLIKFGQRMGRNYEFVGRPYLLWERWYPRWAANYTLRVVTAESNMGVGFEGRGTREDSELSSLSKEGLLTTRSGDVVPIGSVWYEPTDAEFGQGYLRALKRIVEERPKIVSLTIVSSKFIELTKSWLCNVQPSGFAPPNIYWIVLDDESKRALDEWGVGRTVDVTDALPTHSMDAIDIIYGQPAYWKLMLMRTRMVRDLLDRGIDVFLFETDQVWLQNPFHYFQKEMGNGADMVGTLDTQHNVAGNVLLLKAVMSTRRMWSEVYHRFKMSYDDKNIDRQEKHSTRFVQHDQYQLSTLLLFDTEFIQGFPVALGLLNAQLFVGGSWYSGMYSAESAKRPIIINNNFISGSEKKKSRAMFFGHWFLKDDGHTCNTQALKKALQYDFVKPQGKWRARVQE